MIDLDERTPYPLYGSAEHRRLIARRLSRNVAFRRSVDECQRRALAQYLRLAAWRKS